MAEGERLADFEKDKKTRELAWALVRYRAARLFGDVGSPCQLGAK